ncbi:MAG: proline--tRNA ligase, partial [Candidatus Altiarchaeota archaeon]|nr:proline--tRNA ligase [Candidatus Altiarchaeota archaeon]
RYDVKGMLVYRGGGMKIIREMSRFLENLLEEDGHEPTLFPILAPESLLMKEAEHIAGFSEEVYWVTHAGGNPLDRRMALRPTSETIMYPMFALWTRTFQDLPIKVHQTVTVYRCETKQTRPLIRSREIYWNEGHTAFATREDALKNIETITEIYLKLINGLLCIPVDVNKRPDWDKFPGAEYTIAFETIMPDGKTLQVATIHNLGQHFSKVFDIVFDDADGKKQYAWQTSYGPGFGRLLAATVSIHGDEKGMVLPPNVAPTQVVIIPILFKENAENVMAYVDEVKKTLEKAGVRVFVDSSDERPGAKHFRWEMEGIPVRIEAGPKDVAEKCVVVVRRDTSEKKKIKLEELDVIKVFEEITDNMRDRAQKRFSERFFKASDMEDLKKLVGEGIVSVGWCGESECVKPLDETGTILSVSDSDAKCIVCGKKGKKIKLAKTY